MTLDAAIADASRAALEFDDARGWLERARLKPLEPFAAEVWATDPSYTQILLVRHRARGWVPPGGTVESGETPRSAATRELLEESGVSGELLQTPAAVTVRSYRADWSPTLGLTYVAVIGRDEPLSGESGQPPRWFNLAEEWDSAFPEDRSRIRAYLHRLAAEHAVGTR
ncbi:NUDIX hydrolase [Amycolatopsis saalfeldensis]|uniref:NUDIX hydrolase n=1 Tax=Amycolatopsis saalfeldensis TaxID=394193 RepID=UPI0015A525EA|nr:NUDIX hydrolase [Amycolatopsis saalfeldensis]